jgi:hypothetical protein
MKINDWFGQPEDEAILTGTKPVIRFEHGTPAGALRRLYPGAAILRGPRHEGRGTRDVFVGFDPGRVKLAIALTERQRQRLTSDEWAATTARLGEALGYPRCCARAYAQDRRFSDGGDGWLMLRRRLETPGPVDPIFNPGPMCYVPCSLGCTATRALARRVRRRLAPAEPALDLRPLPTLLFCREEEFAFLRPEGDPAPRRGGALRFRYRWKAGRLEAGRRRALAAGDELEVGPGTVRVFASGRETAVFSDTFLWWHRRVFHAGFWRRRLKRVMREEAPRP